MIEFAFSYFKNLVIHFHYAGETRAGVYRRLCRSEELRVKKISVIRLIRGLFLIRAIRAICGTLKIRVISGLVLSQSSDMFLADVDNRQQYQQPQYDVGKV